MTRCLKITFTLMVLSSLLLSGIGVMPAEAATLTVTSNSDSGAGSLRQVITDAGSGDTIVFASDMTITLTTGQLAITKNLTIDGSGHNITISGNNSSRIFRVDPGVSLTLDTVKITEGSSGSGGAIISAGTLDISNSTFSNNTTTGDGGAINNSNYADLTITGCTFTGNESINSGGALYITGPDSQVSITESTFSSNVSSAGNGGNGGAVFVGTSTTTISASTFSGNTAADNGGAVYVQGAALTVANSTFHNNSAGDRGGGISLPYYEPHPELTITNSTFSDNSDAGTEPSPGGTLYFSDGTIHMSNSIVANSGSFYDCTLTGTASIDTNVDNLIEDGRCSASLSGDPSLGTLGSNGGPTQTIRLLSGSQAIDKGDTNCPATDQRGVARGSVCDLGAYERSTSFTVLETEPASSATISDLSTITVGFDDNAVHDGSANAANNVNNYLLIRSGESGFNTQSCAGGVVSDDIRISISSTTYDIPSMTATLNLASALTDGSYRLFICGTTSVWSADGVELNGGASDTTVDFTISGSQVVTSAAAELPATGFAPHSAGDGAAILPSQPAASFYSSSEMILEIPALGLNMPVVGVPLGEDGWDVAWLGDSAGWLEGTAFPTWEGNTVITGHVWDAWNQPGPFAQLKTLQYGDRIMVHGYGETHVYEVRGSSIVWHRLQAGSVFPHEDSDWLTLLTCETWNPGSGEYLYRRAVRAVLVDVD